MVTPLRIGTTGDYAPFSTRDSNARFEGFDIALVDLLISGPMTIIQLGWADIESAIATQRVDCIASGLTITDARKRYGLFSRPYLENRTVVMGRLGTMLPVAKLGVNRGGYLETVARAKFSGSKLITVTDNSRLPEHLLAGEFDAFLSDAIEAASFAARHPVVVLQELEIQHHGFLVHSTLASLQAHIDDGITRLIQNGQLKQLAHTHGINPTLIPRV